MFTTPETARGEGLPVYELNYPFPDDRLARTHGMDVPQLTGGREDRRGSSQVELCRCLEGASLYTVPLFGVFTLLHCPDHVPVSTVAKHVCGYNVQYALGSIIAYRFPCTNLYDNWETRLPDPLCIRDHHLFFNRICNEPVIVNSCSVCRRRSHFPPVNETQSKDWIADDSGHEEYRGYKHARSEVGTLPGYFLFGCYFFHI